MAGSDDRLWTVRNSSDDRDRRVPCIQGIIHIPGLQTFLPGILRICRLGTGGQYGRRRQHRCADLHRWVALHLLLIATPFSLGSAIFITEISPKFGEKFYRPVVEIFAGIPSVVYGWVGLTVLVPAIKILFDRQVGHSILAAGLVLAVMIFPTITSVAADALHSVPKECRMAAYGLGSTRWQTIYRIVVPAAAPGIISGVILGLARAFGEALAVAMVIGQTTALPTSIFSTTKTLTTEIAAQMGNAMEGGEMKSALWTMALLLFAISLFFIFLIHHVTAVKPEKEEKTSTSVKTSTTAVPVKQFAAKGEN